MSNPFGPKRTLENTGGLGITPEWSPTSNVSATTKNPFPKRSDAPNLPRVSRSPAVTNATIAPFASGSQGINRSFSSTSPNTERQPAPFPGARNAPVTTRLNITPANQESNNPTKENNYEQGIEALGEKLSNLNLRTTNAIDSTTSKLVNLISTIEQDSAKKGNELTAALSNMTETLSSVALAQKDNTSAMWDCVQKLTAHMTLLTNNVNALTKDSLRKEIDFENNGHIQGWDMGNDQSNEIVVIRGNKDIVGMRIKVYNSLQEIMEGKDAFIDEGLAIISIDEESQVPIDNTDNSNTQVPPENVQTVTE